MDPICGYYPNQVEKSRNNIAHMGLSARADRGQIKSSLSVFISVVAYGSGVRQVLPTQTRVCQLTAAETRHLEFGTASHSECRMIF